MLMVYFMDNLDRKREIYISKHASNTDFHLNICGLFITLLMQYSHPWRIVNTFYPILIFSVIMFIKVIFIRRSRLNRIFFFKGFVAMMFGVFFFIRGLDDDNDYLRINHGLWHCSASIATFYLWQSIDKDKPVQSLKNVKLTSQARFELLKVVKVILTLKFFTPLEHKQPHYQ